MKALALWKRILVWFLGGLASLFISIFILGSILNNTIFDKQFVNEIVGSRAAFDVVGNSIHEGLINRDTDESVDEVKSIVSDYVEYEEFQNSVTQATESVFEWLGGSTQDIDLNVELLANQTEFKKFISELLVVKLDQLPACASQQATNEALKDPFGAECRPAGFNESTALQLLETVPDQQFNEFYDSATITDESLDLNEAEIENLPDLFQLIQKLPLFALLVGLVFIAAGAAIIRIPSESLMFAGRNLIKPSSGVFLLGLLLFVVFKVPTKVVENLQTQLNLNGDSLNELAQLVESKGANVTFLYAGTICAIGVALYIFGRRNHYEKKPETFKHLVESEVNKTDFRDFDSSNT